DGAMEPVRSPAPTTPSQAAEKAPNVNARAESVSISKADVRVFPWGVIAIGGRSPNVLGIVQRYIDHLGISRLDVDSRLISLHFGRDRLLPIRPEFTGCHGSGAHPLHGI